MVENRQAGSYPNKSRRQAILEERKKETLQQKRVRKRRGDWARRGGVACDAGSAITAVKLATVSCVAQSRMAPMREKEEEKRSKKEGEEKKRGGKRREGVTRHRFQNFQLMWATCSSNRIPCQTGTAFRKSGQILKKKGRKKKRKVKKRERKKHTYPAGNSSRRA